ncbi:MAG: hypothetical protein AUH43_21910 [Acidobacteria bacterium 13_1_40CM_65_14]|nr:MAG: hypothetical protein AUH43_21910 [Acidobacteria bacterium 13_1_40CM_65_14]
MIDALLHDVRYSFHSLRRAPGFSVVVIATLALAIGANTALFSLFNAIVLRPLPVREPDRLAVMTVTDERGTQNRFVYATIFEAFRAEQRAFELLSMYSGGGVLRAEARGVAVDGGVESMMPEYFEMLGVRPIVGRLINHADASNNDGAPVIVIGYRFWQRQFGGDPRAVGETLRVDGTPLTIIGVTQPGFHGLQADAGADFFVTVPTLRPIAGDMTRPLRTWNIIGRLRPRVTLEQARAEVAAEWPAIQAAAVPAGLPSSEQAEIRSQRVKVESISTGFSTLRRRYADPLFVLIGLTTLLLAIGCANLSGLLLVRAVARNQSLAVRRALGASRGRLVQQLLVESLMLSAAGVLAAMPLAWWASRLLGATLASTSVLPMAMTMTPDGRVLGAAALVAVVTGLVVGVLPAWLATADRASVVASPTRASTHRIGRTGRILLVAQIALSLVLLVGAGLFARSLSRLRANDSAFPARQILWTRLWLNPGDRGATLGGPYYWELARQFSQIPGVESAAFAYVFPAYFNFSLPSETFARADSMDQSGDVSGLSDAVSPGFFQTVGIARLQGRDFTWDDDARAAHVAIVSATLARKLFPNGDPIGQRIRMSRDPAHRPIEIVGVVNDAPIGNIREPHVAALFRPILQEPARARVPIALVRGGGNTNGVRDAYVKVVVSQGRHFVRTMYTLEAWVDEALLQERLVSGLSSFFAALAVLLACVGVYGLLAYAVARRTREIGIRIALGASRRSVLGMIAREGFTLAALGVAIGIPCALAAGRFIQSLLYGLAANDAATLAGAAAFFLVVGVASGLIPAHRASTVDPMRALRQD